MVATVDQPTGTRRIVDANAWWRLWAIAAFAHVVSNGIALPFALRSLTNLAVGLVALAVIITPGHRWARTALVALIPVSAFAEAPFLGNHWLLAAAISLAALIARPWGDDGDWWRRFAPTGRLLLLVFYSFAAFAKLNSGFFDPESSCARFFANQMLGFWQIPEVGGTSLLATVLPYATVVIELSVPVLLLVRRTRSFGVWLAVAFHMALTLDLIQHFFDFTLTLIPLFLLFAPSGTLARFDQRLPRSKLAGGRIWIALATLMVVAATLPFPVLFKVLTALGSWALWLGLAFIIVGVLVLPGPTRGGSAPPLAFKPASFAGAALVAVIVLNGLAPYLELKTAAGFNMYANLVTADGQSNHFVIPGTANVRSVQAELATIVSSSDEDLAEYVDSGFDLPLDNLRDYLADHPQAAVTFDVVLLENGRRQPNPNRVELARAGDHPEWIDRQPWYLERFLTFRAVASEEPPACQSSFLPAR